MTILQQWVKLPSAWIEARGLKHFNWKQGSGSSNTAALMSLIVIAHHADKETGTARISYDDLGKATHLSRSLISKALTVLDGFKLIEREPDGQSTYKLLSYDPSKGWAMLPARALYSNEGVAAFRDFHLRKPAELHALKLYLAFAARRDRNKNSSFMTYEQIHEYTGVPEAMIKTALSILAVNGLIVTEQTLRQEKYGFSHSYRLSHLFPTKHMGTIGRASL